MRKTFAKSMEFSAILISLIFVSILASAAAPNKIAYQGRLRSAGQPVSGSYSIDFKIYTTEGEVSPIWSETASVDVSTGVFSHELGSITALDIEWSTGEHWLELTVTGQVMSPRERFLNIPYSYESNTLSGNPYDYFVSTCTDQSVIGYKTFINSVTVDEGMLVKENLTVQQEINASYSINTNSKIKENGNPLIPAGTIITYVLKTPPPGYLYCDGTAYDTSAYPELFAVVGYSFGNTAGQFHVPDFRGYFLRGMTDGEATDPDANNRAALNGGNDKDNVGSVQDDQIVSHLHYMTSFIAGGSSSRFYGGPGEDSASSTMQTTSTGGNETRPKNVYVTYMIKY